MRYHNSMKVPKPQVRAARRSIVYFREGIESRNRGFDLQALEWDHLREGRNRSNKMTSQPSQGAKTWFQHPPHTASSETSVCALRADAERASIVGICLAK